MKIIQVALAALSLALTTTAAAQDLQNQLIGTWDFVVAQVKAPDGKISFPFGEFPKGMLVFTPDGRFMQIHVAGDVPKIKSNNRLTGTPEEYAEIMRRSISVFGTYSIDEAKKTVTYHIVSASFPTGRGSRRRARSTSSPPTSLSTRIRTSRADAGRRRISTRGRSKPPLITGPLGQMIRRASSARAQAKCIVRVREGIHARYTGRAFRQRTARLRRESRAPARRRAALGLDARRARATRAVAAQSRRAALLPRQSAAARQAPARTGASARRARVPGARRHAAAGRARPRARAGRRIRA